METLTVINHTNDAHINIEKVLYTGKVNITGGREGAAKSDDDRLNVKLTSPGASGAGTNPEQLLAAGWSACFLSAIKLNAGDLQIRVPANAALNTEVDLAAGEGGYYLQARLNVSLPGLTVEQATKLVEAAHQTCPYSKATRGNINVTINVAI